MKVKISYISYIFLSLQIFFKRLFFFPSSYLVPYLFFFKPQLSNISIFYILYSVYSLFISTNFISTLVYSLLFIFNTFVYNAFKDPKILLKIKRFNLILRKFLIFGTIFSLILLILNLQILPNKIYLTVFNPINALNTNSYIFIVYYFTFAAIILKNGKDIFFGSILLLITESRTGLVFIIFIILQILDNQNLLPNFKRINLKIFLPLVFSFTIIFTLNTGTDFLNNVSQNINSTFEFSKNLGNISTYNPLTLNYLRDGQRICLTLNNIKHIEKTFPVGTGIGIKSYQNSLKRNDLGCKNNKKYSKGDTYIRAHNFYISYLAEMGIFFFPLLFFLLSKLRNNKTRFIILGLLVGFIGQEYLTSPFTWLIIGLSENTNYD